MQFPIKKKIWTINDSETQFLKSYQDVGEIPILPHPGAFGKIRKFHQHEGIDLYCLPDEPIFAMQKGVIIDIFPFTGEIAQTPWWNDTWAILIKSEVGVLNYGEIIPLKNLEIGQTVDEGQLIGNVKTVLKADKGRPVSMLHLEYYTHDTLKAISGWKLGDNRCHQLLNPTSLLMDILKNND